MNDNDNNNSFAINTSLKIDNVHLRVSNLKESVNFYQSILGFRNLKDKSNTKTVFLTYTENNTNNDADSFKKEKVSPLLVLNETDNNNEKSKTKE